MKRLFREPVVHFLLIGCALFILRAWLADAIEPAAQRIVVSPSQVEALATQFSRTWLRSPTEEEMSGLINEHVRDVVYHREALALGLDKNDPMIRRRMRQKLELLLDDMTGANVPTDQVLTAFMQEHADKFRMDPKVSFRQVYLSPDERQELKTDAEAMLAQLQAGARPEEVGDPTLLGYEFKWATQRDVERQFGDTFARRVVALEPGVWTGPLFSGLGGHLVMVTEREEGRLPELAEIRTAVEREWLAIRRKESRDAVYHKLLERYEVVIERTESEE